MNASLFRRKRRRDGQLHISPFWSIKYQLDGAVGYKVHKLKVREKQVAQQLLAEFVKEKESESHGVIPPAPLRNAAVRSLSDHLSDFTADLRARGRAKMYVYNIEHRVTKLSAVCGWSFLRDVTADGFVTWRKSQTLAAKTLNEYLDAMNGLLNWMKRQGRINVNPLAVVGRVDVRGKEVRKARALSDDEVARLLAASPARKPVYLAALLTGLRRSELKALRWGDIHLDEPRPFLTVRASTAKNRKAATIWLRDDLTAELDGIRPAGECDGLPVFPPVPKMATFRDDLKAAGIKYEKDSQGREVFFHSLRHTLATNLARGGVAPRVAMELMRHSEMRLTMKTYTDAALLPTIDAIERLPRFELPAVEKRPALGRQDAAESGTQKGTQNPVRDGQSVSRNDEVIPPSSLAENTETGPRSHEKHLIVRFGHTAGVNRGTRIRT